MLPDTYCNAAFALLAQAFGRLGKQKNQLDTYQADHFPTAILCVAANTVPSTGYRLSMLRSVTILCSTNMTV